MLTDIERFLLYVTGGIWQLLANYFRASIKWARKVNRSSICLTAISSSNMRSCQMCCKLLTPAPCDVMFSKLFACSQRDVFGYGSASVLNSSCFECWSTPLQGVGRKKNQADDFAILREESSMLVCSLSIYSRASMRLRCTQTAWVWSCVWARIFDPLKWGVVERFFLCLACTHMVTHFSIQKEGISFTLLVELCEVVL